MIANDVDLKDENEALKYLELYQKEWEIIINAQMHFNDLIVKYRQIFLTIFFSVTTAGFSLKLDGKISTRAFISIIVAVIIGWCLAFLLDYFYYYQLLLASVEEAKKFDNNPMFKKLGLFGLTKRISTKISPFSASIIIWIFYGFPLIVILAVIFYFKWWNPAMP